MSFTKLNIDVVLLRVVDNCGRKIGVISGDEVAYEDDGVIVRDAETDTRFFIPNHNIGYVKTTKPKVTDGV